MVAGRYLAVGGSTLTPDEVGFIGTSVTGLPDDWSFEVFTGAILFSIAAGYPE